MKSGWTKKKARWVEQRALRGGERARYQLRPGGSSSRAIEIRFMVVNIA